MNQSQVNTAIEALSGWEPTNKAWLSAFEGKVFAGSAAVSFYSSNPRQVDPCVLIPVPLTQIGAENTNAFMYEGKEYYVLNEKALTLSAIRAKTHNDAQGYLFDAYLMAIDLMSLVDLRGPKSSVMDELGEIELNTLHEVLEAKAKLAKTNAMFSTRGFGV